MVTVELSHLRLLLEIQRQGSMTGAAARLSFTPSAVSQQVKRLEATLGVELLERHARGVRLSAAGELVAARAQEIETQVSALRIELDDLAGARSGQLTLGVFPTFAASLLPQVMARFRELHPGVDLRIRSSRQRHLQRMLRSREVDLALAWDYPGDPMALPETSLSHLCDDSTVVLAPRDHAATSARPLDLRHWRRSPWILRGDAHPITAVMIEACRAAGYEPDVIVEANDYMEAQAMVAAGLGVSVAPRITTHFLRSDVEAIDMRGQLPSRRIMLARVADREESAAARAMRALLERLVPNAVAQLEK